MKMTETKRYIVQVYVGALSDLYEALTVEASKQTTAEEIVSCIVDKLSLRETPGGVYELAEVIGDNSGQECKERCLQPAESPVQLMMLWPKIHTSKTSTYKFYLREKANDYVWRDNFVMDSQLIKDYFNRFLYQPKDREYPDLCQLPDLNEETLLENLKNRFMNEHIYTYVGSILIAVNPFQFYPIYNPKYVKLYQNRRLGPNLPPHIFAVADTAYHCMLKDRKNQCIVISGESGSGKTESTNFLLHHLTALSQKGTHGCGVEQTILSAGPVLEAFGNAKTAHNNNSSRFGKFIQVNYKENGMVHGAVVQKYLLEKSRICTQGRNERNYHVFYYLLEGANEQERQILHLKRPDQYNYLNKNGCSSLENVDESYEFSRLKQSMEMVGFTAEKQRRLFSVLSAVLLLGNVEFQPRKSAYHHDEAVGVKNPEVVALISELLRVKQETLMQALTAKRARASGETLVINYRLPEAIASRDAMAKCLYGALFDWIVLQVNHALLSKKDTLREHQGNSIGVLDIFGFEDFGPCNSFEQLCINYANEHLQHYFNQHVFKYEQEEYRKENIRWKNIDFMDNTGCLYLIEGKPNGLLCLLDDQCNFPGATNETLLQKFNTVHKENKFYQKPQKKEPAFIIVHYAGKVKYQVTNMREKNLDLMRQDIVGVLKNSSMAFVRELVGADPVAVFRWAIVRAFFRAYFAFHEAGRRHRQGRVDGNKNNIQQRYQRNHIPNENIISLGKQRNMLYQPISRNNETEVPNNQYRLSWPQFYNRGKISNVGKSGENDRSRRKDVVTNSSGQANYDRVLRPEQAMAMQRANQIVMKNKSFRPRERGKKGLKNLQSVKTLAGRTGLTPSNQGQLGKARKQPMTVTAQFQQSLQSLMETLNQANPFFIRCIKSNSEKIPKIFDVPTVQRQLRYTGMLETVRIRRAGFNVRLTYDEFIQLYRILLPKGLLSSQNDVRNFLSTLNLDRENYQVGTSKIFLRESEKDKLDSKLHQQIMASIMTLQRWFRACLERQRFLRIQNAVITLQSYCRMFMVQKNLSNMVNAVLRIQKIWRGYRVRSWYKKLKKAIVCFQALARGYVGRKLYASLKAQAMLNKKEEDMTVNSRLLVSDGADEAFVSKGSSQEELENDKFYPERDKKARDSDDGILEDGGEIENNGRNKLQLRAAISLPTVTTYNSNSTVYPTYSLAVIMELERIENKVANNQEQIVKPKEQLVTTKRKVTKAHKTIDLSDIHYTYETKKGSEDSLNSVRSYESQFSESGVPCSGDSNPYSKHELWSSTSTKSETDSEFSISSHHIQSAPPHCGNNQSTYPSFDDSPYPVKAPHKNVTRALPIGLSSYALPGKREKAEGFINLAPIRRRDGTDIHKPDKENDHVPDKAKQMLGFLPIPPSRNSRNNRRSHVKSLGEEVTDSAAFDKIAHLGTIDEFVGTYPPDIQMRDLKDYSDNSKLLIAESDLSNKSLTPKRTRSGIGLDLKRRNSDPATKVSSFSDHPEGQATKMEWQTSSDFSIAGHKFRIIKKFNPEDKCVSCNDKMDQSYTHSYKCSECKMVFHPKCIQNKKVLETPCGNTVQSSKPGRRKHRKTSRTPYDINKQHNASTTTKFNYRTSEFTDSTDQIISDAKELQEMQDFITKKICCIEKDDGKKPSEVDRLFKLALREFKDNLVQFYSAANKTGFEAYSVKYKDLIMNFMQAMDTVCQREQKQNADFPVTMGVNAFRGFMNEFMSSRGEPEKPSKTKKKKDKKRKGEEITTHAGHTFLLTIINIPTACEICSSFFMWPLEKSLVCQSCKMTCHKKCYMKSTYCTKDATLAAHDSKKIFGVPLSVLLSEDCKIPVIIERLLATIEMYFLYIEGIYRKPGVSSKVKELKFKMEENKDEVNFADYQVHVLASVLKCFLREMPEPLLTFECYENFLTVANISNPQDRVATLYEILKKLPTANYDLMERLIFHLARVALHEEVNRMSAASLAIVFAPCILRTNKDVPAQDSLLDICSQTQCIETIITEQLQKIRNTLDDIDTLDTACQAATNRLSSLRSSKVFSPDELLPQPVSSNEEEENLLENHIQEIQKEKEHLTSTLPTLTHATSDDDMLSTDGDGSLDDISCVAEPRRLNRPIIRSISGGDARQSNMQKLRRQTSSDVPVKVVGECEETPIMV
ncbi:PREDICTED: unconventional myosin-IXa-like isoform X2 [Nicrophorus vespilloides]|uniref:Unconventional myosin-IXa-like isoform X2 n=1 Tax=Nicrophorus vespilloides TaxID=110193 RepID=A0ABM1MQ59_NICVS|nr:PREDICTED: unconventional myosin-IXa-like isoform X2 [Nicrophorus vespilloides]